MGRNPFPPSVFLVVSEGGVIKCGIRTREHCIMYNEYNEYNEYYGTIYIYI